VSDGLRVLCLNSGSSSLKLALYELAAGREQRLATGAVAPLGTDPGRLWVRDGAGSPLAEASGTFADARAAVESALDAVARLDLPPPNAVGHRVVHGGPDHVAPERVGAALVASLRRLVPLAPLHLPAAIDGIEAVAAHFPGLPQVACFDTAFHRRMPAVAQRLALPRAMWDEGVRRYGFHGLSYEYVVAEVGAQALGRAVIAHLGNGASLAAVRDGQPIDTTMGLTPTGGVMMGTRSGDLDPGVLLYVLRRHGGDAAALERLVNQDAGLRGVSGTSADMQTLLERRAHDPHAAQAVEMFCYQVRKQVGAFAAALGGLDTLVFTGGIGERAAPVRREVCRELAHLGITLDPGRNDAHAAIVSADGSACTVRVVTTDEDLMIARHTRGALAPA
jgi:acetate kinase